MFAPNLEKRDWVQMRLDSNAHPGGRTRLVAKAYYGRLYYKEDRAQNTADVVAWRVRRGRPAVPVAAPPAPAPPAPAAPPVPPAPPAPPAPLPGAAGDRGNAGRGQGFGPLARQPPPDARFRPLQKPFETVRGEARLRGMGDSLRTTEFPPFNEEGMWEPGWNTKISPHLGTGGQGNVWLYFRQDENGRIIDRVTMKDTISSQASWSAFHNWHGNMPSKEAVPMEVWALQKLRASPGSESSDTCIEYRGHDIRFDLMWYRLYTNYCVFAGLDQLIDANADEGIPEPALWCIFEDLIRAALVLEQGGVDGAVQDWKSLVHRDLKLGNVLLDNRGDTQRYPRYPRSRLGDFGYAIETDDDDPMNPTAYCGPGTPGWRPREQVLLQHITTHLPVVEPKLNTKTNVWGIAAIIMRLMNEELNPDEPKFVDERPVQLTFTPVAEWKYSQRLRNVVAHGVQHEQADRPDLHALLEEVQAACTGGDGDCSQGMRNGSVNDGRHDLEHQEEKQLHMMGFTLPL